ncbi:MAG: 30S ribosomal protein S6 [Bacteroidia bacterium]|nr:30S ribosomal protein S6 [Bacteroidia bacterium]MCO5253262.1 30S ribosomal protein S6 [Bacteroidota bacterium]MCZ2130354.1 30S ribosomal protein S6 [Bacteroidia bacterium]
MSLKNYESVIILTPVLSEQQMKDAVTGYRELITEQGGKVIHENNWGLAKLAYPINKKVTGFYHIFEFQAEPEFIATLELSYRRDERVMRFMTTALDKHAVIYNERKRKGEIGNSKAAEAARAKKKADVEIIETEDIDE